MERVVWADPYDRNEWAVEVYREVGMEVGMVLRELHVPDSGWGNIVMSLHNAAPGELEVPCTPLNIVAPSELDVPGTTLSFGCFLMFCTFKYPYHSFPRPSSVNGAFGRNLTWSRHVPEFDDVELFDKMYQIYLGQVLMNCSRDDFQYVMLSMGSRVIFTI